MAEVAKAFGCKVIYYSTSGIEREEPYEKVSFEELLAQSDIISVHAPLNDKTRNLFDKEAFAIMKNSAYFINVGRGPIVVEKDLADALNAGEIAGAGLDVLSKEPILKENPLFALKDSDKLIITPHIAWASKEARIRLMDGVYRNVEEFMNGQNA